MDREVGYNIYLPPSYESAADRRYPIVYYLQGASRSELSGYEASAVQRLVKEGKSFERGHHGTLQRGSDASGHGRKPDS